MEPGLLRFTLSAAALLELLQIKMINNQINNYVNRSWVFCKLRCWECFKLQYRIENTFLETLSTERIFSLHGRGFVSDRTPDATSGCLTSNVR